MAAVTVPTGRGLVLESLTYTSVCRPLCAVDWSRPSVAPCTPQPSRRHALLFLSRGFRGGTRGGLFRGRGAWAACDSNTATLESDWVRTCRRRLIPLEARLAGHTEVASVRLAADVASCPHTGDFAKTEILQALRAVLSVLPVFLHKTGSLSSHFPQKKVAHFLQILRVVLAIVRCGAGTAVLWFACTGLLLFEREAASGAPSDFPPSVELLLPPEPPA